MDLEAIVKNFSSPEDIRYFPKGRLELITLSGATIGRAIFEPGWRWSESVQPLSGTKSCLAAHLQYHIRGTMCVLMDDGTELLCKPGDIAWLPEGHDAWTVGDEAVEVLDFHGMIDYSREKQARIEKQLNRLVMESPVPTIIQDGDGEEAHIQINQCFQDVIGFGPDTIHSWSLLWEKICPDEKYRKKIQKLWNTRLKDSENNKVIPLELNATCEDNTTRIFEVHLTKTDIQSIAVFIDLTEKYQLKDYLSYIATHDELTKLLNRRGYRQAIEQAWKLSNFSNTVLALLMVDIDYFKQYNDLYGHAAGDECLQLVANILKNSLRRSGDIVARIGGEEFAIIMQNTTNREALKMAENLCKNVEKLNSKHEGSLVSDSVTILSLIHI